VDEGNANGPTTAERMRAYAEHATPLAAQACSRALAAAQVEPAEITHLVTVSCSGFAAPGVDVQLFNELGLSAGVSRTHVGFMGCHGALNGLRVARAFVEADPNARVLLCAVELCTLHHQYGWNPDQIVANALFADGSAAVVCVPAADDSHSDAMLSAVSSASTIVPETEDLMSWRIGDNGFQMGLSARVPDVIRSELRPWMAGWLGKQGIELDQVGVLAEFGNMSSPTILFILDRLQRQNAPGPWVLLAFGPGLTIEAALVSPGIAPLAPMPAVVGTSAAH